jgi:multidrug efflux pump subunit AcrA (membrane-fusion protein)
MIKRPGLLKIFLLIGIPVVLVALAALLYFGSGRDETIYPKRGEIVEAVYSLGKVKARREFELKVGVLTTVDRLYVHEGDQVRAAQPLLRVAEGESTFRAPFAGIVSLVSADEGVAVAPNVVLLRLEDLSSNYIEVSLEQQGALRVQKGQDAEIVFESVRGEKLKGHVTSVFSRNDEFLAYIDVEGGLKSNVLPGMSADVAITVSRRQNALLIPVKAVNNGHVTARRAGKKQKIILNIGAIDGQWAEVLGDNLQVSDEIVVEKKK